jgi:SAM-dependent methyltransferase
MSDGQALLARAWGRVNRAAAHTRDRLRGLPLRADERRRGIPIPPSRLIHLVSNTMDVAWFLEGGAAAALSIRAILADNGVDIAALGAILDFGCGAGRVVRHWSDLRAVEIHGTDYNPALISWCARNLPFARFRTNRLEGRLDFEDGRFGLIYALSVFTHLSEPLQAHWIGELTRVLRPGGFLILTTHGDCYLPRLSDEERSAYLAGRLVVRSEGREGSNHCAAFHPESFVRSTLARGLDVVDFRPEGARGNPRQDLYLIRKPIGAR